MDHADLKSVAKMPSAGANAAEGGWHFPTRNGRGGAPEIAVRPLRRGVSRTVLPFRHAANAPGQGGVNFVGGAGVRGALP